MAGSDGEVGGVVTVTEVFGVVVGDGGVIVSAAGGAFFSS